MTQLAHRDSTPERSFTSTGGYAGPVLADVTCPTGVVYVTADRSAEVAAVRILTQDGPDSPAAEAVRGATITQDAERLVVVVPDVPHGAGGFGNASFTSFGGGSTYVNGVRFDGPVSVVNGRVIIGGGAVNMTNGVEVHITVPAGSGVRYRSENGSLHTYGPVAAMEARTTNGSVRAEQVGRLKARASNGSVKAGTVTEWLDAESDNGSVKVEDYAGSACRVRAGNGSVALTVARGASGRIEARAGNGSVKLYGVRGRTDLDVDATAGNGTVRKC
ncbi:hypothetical protein ACF053_29910 [Streptomyces kanasensis]|uniref:hypothetical protein n=1 Tax=Streptomyces kanasensis TaxID=936756 RepID=UPI00370082D8